MSSISSSMWCPTNALGITPPSKRVPVSGGFPAPALQASAAAVAAPLTVAAPVAAPVAVPTPVAASARVLIAVADPALRQEVESQCALLGQSAQVLTRTHFDVSQTLAEAPPGTVVMACSTALGGLGKVPANVTLYLVARSAVAADFRAALRVGARDVLALPADADQLCVALMQHGAAAAHEDARHARVFTVSASCGGGGATVLASALALQAAKMGLRTALVDAVPYGGGIDVTLGLEQLPGARWHDIVAGQGGMDASALCQVLPRKQSLQVLAFDRQNPVDVAAWKQAFPLVLSALRDSMEVVIVDAPWPHAMSIAASSHLYVVPQSVRAVAAAASQLRHVQQGHRPTVITSGPAAGGICDADIAGAIGQDVAFTFRRHPKLAAMIERGGIELHAARHSVFATAAQVLEAHAEAPAAQARAPHQRAASQRTSVRVAS